MPLCVVDWGAAQSGQWRRRRKKTHEHELPLGYAGFATRTRRQALDSSHFTVLSACANAVPRTKLSWHLALATSGGGSDQPADRSALSGQHKQAANGSALVVLECASTRPLPPDSERA